MMYCGDFILIEMFVTECIVTALVWGKITNVLKVKLPTFSTLAAVNKLGGRDFCWFYDLYKSESFSLRCTVYHGLHGDIMCSNQLLQFTYKNALCHHKICIYSSEGINSVTCSTHGANTSAHINIHMKHMLCPYGNLENPAS